MDHAVHETAAHQHRHGTHTDHTGHEKMFRNRFWVSLVLTVPVLLFSPMVQEWFGFSMPEFTGSNLIGPVFAIAIFAYGGIPFLQMAVPEVQNRKPGMMTLISLAITVAFAYSLFAAVTGTSMGFFWEMATLIDIMLLGHWMEMRSVRQASGALNVRLNGLQHAVCILSWCKWRGTVPGCTTGTGYNRTIWRTTSRRHRTHLAS